MMPIGMPTSTVTARHWRELCPDSFWDYISDTYDLSEEDAVAAMNQYMQDYSDTLGGDLSYKMEQNGVTWPAWAILHSWIRCGKILTSSV